MEWRFSTRRMLEGLRPLNNIRIVILLTIVSLGVNIGCAVVGRACGMIRIERDAATYYSYAQQIREQGIWVLNPSKLRGDFVGPGYPAIMALSQIVTGTQVLGPILSNAAALTLLALVAYALGRQLGSPTIGLLSMLWHIIYLPHLVFIPTMTKEAWICLIFAMAVYLLLREIRTPPFQRRFVLLPLVFVLLLHIDERFLVYSVVFPALLLFCGNVHWKVRAGKAAAFVILLVMGLIPWQVRNYVVYDRPMLLTSRIDSIIAHVLPDGSVPQPLPKALPRRYLTDEQLQDIIHEREIYRRPPEEVKQIRSGNVPHLFSMPEQWRAAFVEFWRPCKFKGVYMGRGFKFQIWDLKHNIASLLLYGTLLPFFLYGLIVLLRQKRFEGAVLGIIMVVHTAIHVFIVSAITRYRLPLDTLIIVLAMFGVHHLAGKFHRKHV